MIFWKDDWRRARGEGGLTRGARRMLQSCRFVRGPNDRTPQALRLSAFGTLAAVFASRVMQKIHMLTDY
jgi:hypothetical protein